MKKKTTKKTTKKETKKLDFDARQEMGFELVDSIFEGQLPKYLSAMRNNTTDQEFFDEVNQTIYNFIILLTNLLGEMVMNDEKNSLLGAILFRDYICHQLQCLQLHQLIDKVTIQKKGKKS